MTAVSPYAPHRRNSLLRRRSSSSGNHPNGNNTALAAIMLVALRVVWSPEYRERFWEFWRRTSLWGWMQQSMRSLLTLPQQQKQEEPRDSDDDQSSLDRIRDNQRLIQKVLQYWFGQYTPDESQKHLWMIAHSSEALRQQVDQDITLQFEALLLELVGDKGPSKRWKEWCHDDIYGYSGKLAAIVVLDQCSRHILRHYEQSSSTTNLPSKSHLDEWALRTAELLVDVHAQEITCGMIPLPQYIFALMPFRHQSTKQSVALVQQRIEDCAGLATQLEAMLGRFRKATNRRMAVLQDEARRTGNTTQIHPSDDLNGEESSPTTTFTDDDILETFAFDADMTPAHNHPVVKTIQIFLQEQGIQPSSSSDTQQHPRPVIVSLSGGVDSMVIASVLAHLRNSCCYSNLQLWAVHIDYANRPESGAEADFVRRYCERLDIPFQCRRIEEVTRGITARDDYERIARDLRYTSYKETIALALQQQQQQQQDSATTITVGVMLGHHRGDLRENVLSNAHKGCGPLDLSGMTAVSRNDGVTIYRPLLLLEKSFIFDYAHKFGVPYFKDTTPHWSTRGKLRNKLIPLLEEIYGDGSMKNLSNLAVESDECRALLQESMIGPFLDKIERYPMGIVMETTPWKNHALFFWKFVLREALHSASLGMFSDKSVVSFLERVQATKPRSGWLQCRRDYAVYLQDDGRVYVLYPSSFPFAKKDMYNVTGQAVPYGEERRVGPWVVKAEIVSEKADCPETFRLAQKAIPSMDHFMNGRTEFMVEVPTWREGGKFVPRPLVFNKFTKASRPSAWKNNEYNRLLYLKVQETLPLLGVDEVAQAAITDPLEQGCVHVENGEQRVNPTRLVRVTLALHKG